MSRRAHGPPEFVEKSQNVTTIASTRRCGNNNGSGARLRRPSAVQYSIISRNSESMPHVSTHTMPQLRLGSPRVARYRTYQAFRQHTTCSLTGRKRRLSPLYMVACRQRVLGQRCTRVIEQRTDVEVRREVCVVHGRHCRSKKLGSRAHMGCLVFVVRRETGGLRPNVGNDGLGREEDIFM